VGHDFSVNTCYRMHIPAIPFPCFGLNFEEKETEFLEFRIQWRKGRVGVGRDAGVLSLAPRRE